VPKEFLTPPELPSENTCRTLIIPSDKLWLGIFNSALLDTTYAYNFTQVNPTDLTPEETAALCQAIVWAYFDSECSGGACTIAGTDDPPFRIGPAGRVQQQVGTEWVEPEGDYYLPPPEVRTNPSEVDRICLAASNAANTLAIMYEAMIDAYNEDIDPVFGLAQWGGTVTAAVLAAAGLISFGLGTILFGVFQLFYEAFQWLTTDSWDTAFTEKVECYLIECANDAAGVVTFDYDCFMQKIARDTNLGEDLTDIRRFGQIWYMMQILGAQSLDLAGATTAITTPECDCSPPWCYYFDFAVTDGGFVPFDTPPTFGTWVSGSGWDTQDKVITITNPDQARRFVDIYKTGFGTTTLTRVEMVYDYTPGSFPSTRAALTGSSNIAGFFSVNNNVMAVGTDLNIAWSGTQTGVTTLQFSIRSCVDQSTPYVYNGSALIRGILLEGTGDNPFGMDNCPE